MTLGYPRIIAHRCGGALAPENTLAGLDLACRLGCRGIEFDVMLSADGEPMVIHDELLDRTTNGTGPVSEHTARALSALDAGSRHHKAFSGEPIPHFETLMQRAQLAGLWTNIEIKPASGFEFATGAAVARHLGESWRGPGVVSSFSLAALQSARACGPGIPLALLYEYLPDTWADDAAHINASAVHLSARHVNAQVADRLRGMPWACYTVNDVAEADRLFALGCSAIFTDRPDRWTQG